MGICGWFIRCRNDLRRKRQGYKIVKDFHGVKGWVSKWPRRFEHKLSYPTSDPGSTMRVLNSSGPASAATASTCSTPVTGRPGLVEQPDLREDRCLIPVDVLWATEPERFIVLPLGVSPNSACRTGHRRRLALTLASAVEASASTFIAAQRPRGSGRVS
jgi:hypothetical protein